MLSSIISSLHIGTHTKNILVKRASLHSQQGLINNPNGSNSCVAIPTKTNEQVCQGDYGINSNWDGTKNAQGGLICACQAGYEWNESRTSCIVVPVITPVKTSEQIPSIGTGGNGSAQPSTSTASSAPSQKQEVKVSHEAIVAKHQVATVTEINSTIEKKTTDGKATTTLPYHKGVIQKFWEWSASWFHF